MAAPRPAPTGSAPRPRAERAAAPALPTVGQLAWHLTQPAAGRGEVGGTVVVRIGQDAEARAVADLAQRLAALLRVCGVAGRRDGHAPANPEAELAAWLADARGCGVPALVTFAAGLETDGGAVRAALTQPWSSGQTEGQITRLKLLKRQSYGRASFEPLRRPVLLAA